MYLKKFTMVTGAIILTAVLTGVHPRPGEATSPPPSLFTGEVIDTETGKAISGAKIQIDYEGLKPVLTVTNEQGQFKWAGYAPGPKWVLNARVPGLVCLPVFLQSDRYNIRAENIKIYALRPKPQRVRVVSPSNQPVTGVRLTFSRFKFPYQSYWASADMLGESAEPQGITDENGWATLNGLPADGIAEITTSHPQFASGIYPVNLLKQEPATFPLYPSTTITGRVMLGNTRPLGRVQLSTGYWKFQGNGSEQRRVVATDAEGRYRIEDVPPLEVMGRTDLPIDIESGHLWGHNKSQANEISYSQWQGQNVLLRMPYDGKPEQWIYYQTKPGEGVKYEAGQQIQHDLHFEPMALITGQLADSEWFKGVKLPFISYADPRSANGIGQTVAYEDGSFELPVPVGDVTVRFPKRTVNFKNLSPQEIRAVN